MRETAGKAASAALRRARGAEFLEWDLRNTLHPTSTDQAGAGWREWFPAEKQGPAPHTRPMPEASNDSSELWISLLFPAIKPPASHGTNIARFPSDREIRLLSKSEGASRHFQTSGDTAHNRIIMGFHVFSRHHVFHECKCSVSTTHL